MEAIVWVVGIILGLAAAGSFVVWMIYRAWFSKKPPMHF